MNKRSGSCFGRNIIFYKSLHAAVHFIHLLAGTNPLNFRLVRSAKENAYVVIIKCKKVGCLYKMSIDGTSNSKDGDYIIFKNTLEYFINFNFIGSVDHPVRG